MRRKKLHALDVAAEALKQLREYLPSREGVSVDLSETAPLVLEFEIKARIQPIDPIRSPPRFVDITLRHNSLSAKLVTLETSETIEHKDHTEFKTHETIEFVLPEYWRPADELRISLSGEPRERRPGDVWRSWSKSQRVGAR